MNCDDFSEPIKSCLWLEFYQLQIPLKLLMTPAPVVSRTDIKKIRNVEDEFELYVAKTSESIVKVVVCRNRLNSNAKHDDGYALKFSFTISGFNEETKSAIMKHDDENVCVIFSLTENFLKKANKLKSMRLIYELSAIVQMLEFKSLDKNNKGKKDADDYIDFVKRIISKKELKHLGSILQNPELEDLFTGRLILPYLRKAIYTIAAMSKELTTLAESCKKLYSYKEFEIPDRKVSEYLDCIGLSVKKGPLHIYKHFHEYLTAHSIGLDYLKTVASENFVHILDEDYNVVRILAVALMVQDEELIEKAIISFLNRFKKIKRSRFFRTFCAKREAIARLIIHSTRLWVSNHYVFIPGWGKTAKQTTEL